MSENTAGDGLQFQRGEAIVPRDVCIFCRNSILETCFHVGGNVVCANCTARIKAGQLALPAAGLPWRAVRSMQPWPR